MDQNKRKPSGGGVFRIFQQSMKELKTLKDYKIPWKGKRDPGTAKCKDTEKQSKLIELGEESIANGGSNVYKRDTMVTCENFVCDPVKFETSTGKYGDRNTLSNTTKKCEGREGISSRKYRQKPKRNLEKHQMQKRISSVLNRKPDHRRQSSVKTVSSPNKQYNEKQSEKEDWTEELIDITVDSNQNIIQSLVRLSANIYEGNHRHKEQDTCQKILQSTDATFSQQKQTDIDGRQRTVDKTDKENMQNSKIYSHDQKDLTGNTECTSTQLSKQTSERNSGSDVHISAYKTDKGYHEMSQHDILANHKNTNAIRNQMQSHEVYKKHWNFKCYDSKCGVDGSNNNRIIEDGSDDKYKEGSNNVLTEDWSLELNEEDICLSTLQKDKYPENSEVQNSNETDLVDRKMQDLVLKETDDHLHVSESPLAVVNCSDFEKKLSHQKSGLSFSTGQFSGVELAEINKNRNIETVDTQDMPILHEIEASSHSTNKVAEKIDKEFLLGDGPFEPLKPTLCDKVDNHLATETATEPVRVILMDKGVSRCFNMRRDGAFETAAGKISAETETSHPASQQEITECVLIKEYGEVLKDIDPSVLEVSGTEQRSEKAISESGDSYDKLILRGAKTEDKQCMQNVLCEIVYNPDQELEDLQIKTVVKQELEVHAKSEVARKVMVRDDAKSHYKQVEREQPNNGTNQNCKKEHESRSKINCFSWRDKQHKSKKQHSSDRFGRYPYFDGNPIPPRFMKQVYPINGDNCNSKNTHRKRASADPPLMSYSYHENRNHPFKSYSQDNSKYFHGKKDFGSRSTAYNRNDKNNNQKSHVGIKRHTEKPVNECGNSIDKEKEPENVIISTNTNHIPENWHEEIDEQFEGAPDIKHLPVLEAGNESLQIAETSCGENENETEMNEIPDLQLNDLEQVVICLADESKKEHAKTEQIHYLPPSPDEHEQVSFISYMNKNKKEKMKSASSADIDEQNFDNNVTDKIDSDYYPVDLLSDEGFDPEKADGVRVLESASEVFELDYGKECRQHASDIVEQGSLNKSDRNDAVDRKDAVDREIIVNTDPKNKKGETLEKNGGRLVKNEMDNCECVSRQGTNNLVSRKNSAEDNSSEEQITYIKSETSDGLNSAYNNTNSLDVRKQEIQEDIAIGTSKEVTKTTKPKIDHINAEYEGHANLYRSYSYLNPFQTNPLQEYANQFHPAAWQYVEPSFFYSEQYRRWYEQVYTPNYQRYMQFCEYYGMSFDAYYQSYCTGYNSQNFTDSKLDIGTVEEFSKKGVKCSEHSMEQVPQKQKDVETRNHKVSASRSKSNSPDMCVKEHALENKLSDYWADRMPEWVEKQSKVVEMKKETQTVGEVYKSTDDSHTKIENDMTVYCESVRTSCFKTEQMKPKKVLLGSVPNDGLSFLDKNEADINSRKDQFQVGHHKTREEKTSSCYILGKTGSKTAESEQADQTKSSSLLSGIENVVKEDEPTTEQPNEDNFIMNSTASDVLVLTGTDESVLKQQKSGCTCGPDGVQYWLWKTCKCFVEPALKDFVPVYPEDRGVDQGYQSFASLDGAPVVKAKNQSQNRHPRPVHFSTIPPATHYTQNIRHSTPQPSDRSDLGSQDKQKLEINCGGSLDTTASIQKPTKNSGKVGPPPGFRTGLQKPPDLSRNKDHFQYNQPSRMDNRAYNSSYINSTRSTTTDLNENIIKDSSNIEQRQRSCDKVREISDHKLSEIIAMSKARTADLKAAKKKNITQKENVESNQYGMDKSDSGDTRLVFLRREQQPSEETGGVSSVLVEENHPLREQIEKMQSKSKEKSTKSSGAFRESFRDGWKESPPHIVQSSSGIWTVEKIRPADSLVGDETHYLSASIENKNISSSSKLRTVEQFVPETESSKESVCHKVINVAVKKAEKPGDENNEIECSVKLEIPRRSSRSCTVSMSESLADTDVKSNSSSEAKLLDSVRSQSTEERKSSEIKEHDLVEGNLTEKGFMSRKMAGISCSSMIDSNNNHLAEYPPGHPGFGYAGYRMPYRFPQSPYPFENRAGMAPANMRTPTNFSERSCFDNRWGNSPDESLSQMSSPPWMNPRGPFFRPRNFEEPCPWYMPPPQFMAPTSVNEGYRKIYRPIYEQIVSDKAQYEESSYKSPPPPAATVGVTGITPEFEKKAVCSENANVSARKCLHKSVNKNKLVDYNSSDEGSFVDEDSEANRFDSGNMENIRPKQKPIPSLLSGLDETGHIHKRFKMGLPENVETLYSEIDTSIEEFPDLSAARKIIPQKSTQLTRKPMKKLKQSTLKSFADKTPDTETPRSPERVKRNMKLSEVVAAGLKKGTPDQTDEFVATEASNEQLYSTKCQQNLPHYTHPPLPPFPASPFWGMYLTNSRSALEGKDPNENFYSPTNLTAQGPRPSVLKNYTRPLWSPVVKQDPRMLFSPSETDSESQSKKSDGVKQFRRFHNFGVKYIDTHCHLDFLFNRTGFSGNLKAFMEENPETFPETFEGCVAIFCYPTSFSPTDKVLQRLVDEDNVWFAMGCHPKMATDFTEKAEWGMKQCLKHPKCVALGEIGLDYSGTFRQHEEVQKMVFKRQLQLAVKMNKPLVIHCRDAEEDCLEIMKEIVPTQYKIHCHCFTGAYANAQLWMEAFPNLFIGLTPLVTYPSATQTHDLARQIPLGKLLLETDAPYFVPRCRPRLDMEFSNPGLAVTVAKAVAQYQELPVAMVLRQCRVNTKFMYGI